MHDLIVTYIDRYGLDVEKLVLAGIGLGAALLFFGLIQLVGRRNPAAVRLARGRADRSDARFNRGLLLETAAQPKGLLKAVIPANGKDRMKIEEKLLQAGFPGAAALRNYTLVRVVLGFVVPVLFVLLVFAARTPGIPVPQVISARLNGLDQWSVIRVVVILVAAAYYLPAVWLDGRVRERKLRISEAFPNALDLLQISLEAGLGFDAAMTRVGNELVKASPEVAFEFLSVQQQVQAGRPRDAALNDMARRTGVETVRSFASVVQQSMQFGTSMSEALAAHAHEMRLYRELKAQEMANKLPVKMSAVLASLMLPALVMVTIGPVVIRYIRLFGG